MSEDIFGGHSWGMLWHAAGRGQDYCNAQDSPHNTELPSPNVSRDVGQGKFPWGWGGKFDPALREFVAEHEKEFKCTPESESQRKFTREGVTLHRQKKQRGWDPKWLHTELRKTAQLKTRCKPYSAFRLRLLL